MKKFLLNVKYVWNPSKPIMMMRVAWNWILSFFMLRLRYVDFSLGYRCNMSCSHCFNKQFKYIDHTTVSVESFKKVVKDSMKLGACVFSFQGGEPLMYSDLYEYIAAAQPAKNIISVSTNASMLSYGVCQSLKDAGVDILTVSIDSRHNKLGNEFYCYANKLGLKISISVMADDYIERVKEVEENNKIRHTIIFPSNMRGNDGYLHQRDCNLVKRHADHYSNVSIDMQLNWHKYGCGMMKEMIYIDPYGNVRACPFLKKSFGNINHLSIKDIRKEALKSPTLNKYLNICIAGEEQGKWKEYI